METPALRALLLPILFAIAALTLAKLDLPVLAVGVAFYAGALVQRIDGRQS